MEIIGYVLKEKRDSKMDYGVRDDIYSVGFDETGLPVFELIEMNTNRFDIFKGDPTVSVYRNKMIYNFEFLDKFALIWENKLKLRKLMKTWFD